MKDNYIPIYQAQGKSIPKMISMPEDFINACNDFCDHFHMPFNGLVMNAIRSYFGDLERKGIITPEMRDALPRTKRKWGNRRHSRSSLKNHIETPAK
jgi:hypothetical protein